MLLSIIIPVYNVEKFVRRTLESIYSAPCDQNELEVIVVNDGTPDNSMLIVNEFAKHFPMVIINQENRGLSEARNAGLREAKGDFVWFVDSDDWIESENIEPLLDMLRSSDSNVFLCGIKDHFEDGKPPKTRSLREVSKTTKLTPSKLVDLFFRNKRALTPFQQYVISREYFKKNQLSFKKGIYHEDTELVPRILFNTNNVVYTPMVIYNYWQRSGTICTDETKKEKRQEDLINMIINHKKYDCQLSSINKRSLSRFRIYEAGFLLSTMSYEDYIKYRKSPVWEIARIDLLKNLFWSYGIKEFGRRLLFVFSPKLIKRLNKRIN